MQTWPCHCGRGEITRERQQCVIPQSDRAIHRTQHANGEWCETIVPRTEANPSAHLHLR